ncbi:StAR-related lipid transfer protein 9 [Trichuris trichiura]|uniref:StAR-related lipid transfer protein 9 n=1 Tax=Trichuris trichiura TaxID=36087 RepID=A0A077Z9Y6_TRITR|nr:StAR-related lipid transfer protein 9 [Trichuris trichiura]
MLASELERLLKASCGWRPIRKEWSSTNSVPGVLPLRRNWKCSAAGCFFRSPTTTGRVSTPLLSKKSTRCCLVNFDSRLTERFHTAELVVSAGGEFILTSKLYLAKSALQFGWSYIEAPIDELETRVSSVWRWHFALHFSAPTIVGCLIVICHHHTSFHSNQVVREKEGKGAHQTKGTYMFAVVASA